MKKRGQGALEFLMTYGWAFLVILIMIGALAYFGVLSPSKLLPDKCVFGPNVICSQGEYIIKNDTTDTIVVNLVNNFGQATTVSDFTARTDDSSIVCSSPAMNDGILGNWQEGQKVKFTIDCNNAGTLPVGSKIKFEVAVIARPTGSDVEFAKPVAGEIYSTVIEG